MTNRIVDRRAGRAKRTVACVVPLVLAFAALGFAAAGCGGHEGYNTFKGFPTISPETVTLAPGGSTTFYAGVFEIDQHKQTEDFRVKEGVGGGMFATTANPGNYYPTPVLYTAPTKLGTYHIQYVWDAGTKDEKAATATIMVTDTPPYTPVDSNYTPATPI